MKKKNNTLPISQKAYTKFLDRIKQVITEQKACRTMIEALNSYLSGDRENYLQRSEEPYKLVFSMLRFEIDSAINRSTNARQRAQQRKINASSSANSFVEKIIPQPTDSTAETNQQYADFTKEEHLQSVEATSKDIKPIARHTFVSPNYVKGRPATFRKEKPRFLRKNKRPKNSRCNQLKVVSNQKI